MRTAALLLAALSVGCGPKTVDPADPKTWGDREVVWLFVAPEKELIESCKSGKIPRSVSAAGTARGVNVPTSFRPVDVLVPKEWLEKPPTEGQGALLPYSCVNKAFLVHKHTHGAGAVKTIDDSLMSETLIKLKKSAGTSAVFRSLQTFRIVEVRDRDHGGKEPFPFSPAVLQVPTEEREQHETGPIVREFTPDQFLAGVTYKVVFTFGKVKIDPDIECRP